MPGSPLTRLVGYNQALIAVVSILEGRRGDPRGSALAPAAGGSRDERCNAFVWFGMSTKMLEGKNRR